ncbi:MAG: class I SAM-dependent methyltransferase [Candidatus Sabulitectum sp.]|nr:class I SAM-dependent methyltransferase [Candidatus Sabulitectum sp.]
MQSADIWKPGKYVYRNNRLAASRDPEEVCVGSRLITDLIAKFYDENLRKYAKGRLLDLGCGKVPLYSAYKDCVTDNTCVDWGNSLHRNKHLDHECDLTKPLPFKDGEYDTVILSDVLEHMPRPELLMKEISRVMSPDGILLMNVPFYYWIHEEPHDFYRYTEFALRYLSETSGMEVIVLTPTGGAPEIMTDIYAKNILRIPLVGKPLAVIAQWFAALMIHTSLCAKISRATAGKFPLGYFMVAKKK